MFLLFCILTSAIRLRCSNLFEKSTLCRLGKNFRSRRFHNIFLLCAISSVVVSSALNGNISHQDLIGLGLVLVSIDWSFIPSLIRISLTVPMSGYSHFDREKYLKLRSEEAANFFSTMDNVVVDHFLKLLLLNIATFSLLPVLTRINFANSPQNALFFDFRMSQFILKESSRVRSESESAPSRCDTSPFQPVYSANRRAAYLWMAAVLVVLNAIIAGHSIARSAYLDGFPKLMDNYLCFMNAWLCIGSYLVLVTCMCRLRHILAFDCSCEICIKSHPRRSRMRSDSDSVKVLLPNVVFNMSSNLPSLKAVIETPLCSKPDGQNQHHSDGDNEADEGEHTISAISSKLECTMKAPAEDSDVISALSDAEVLQLIREGRLKTRDLETVMKSLPRAVALRRQDLATRINSPHSIDCIPFANYDYRPVMGQCCEEVRGRRPNSLPNRLLFFGIVCLRN
ncbi:unnamed protein product [Hydatigera taeniaeformis]|uniref:G protein-coupled receptor n=1 Tax=Hydatigena taeniaeformis TaxID=6205 RepID=A0A0R3WRL8_HYDTA|nr:unnamed protein product [Hydatigera taeniaeformis]